MRADLVERHGMGIKKAMAEVAEKTGVAASNLTRWFYVKPGLKRIDKGDWLAALVDENVATRRQTFAVGFGGGERQLQGPSSLRSLFIGAPRNQHWRPLSRLHF